MSLRELPARPNLEHLKKQARMMLRDFRAADAKAIARFAAVGVTANPKLADALHVIAREYGFDTWPALKVHIEIASEDPVAALITARRGSGFSRPSSNRIMNSTQASGLRRRPWTTGPLSSAVSPKASKTCSTSRASMSGTDLTSASSRRRSLA